VFAFSSFGQEIEDNSSFQIDPIEEVADILNSKANENKAIFII